MSATSISDALGAGQFSNFGEAVEALYRGAQGLWYATEKEKKSNGL